MVLSGKQCDRSSGQSVVEYALIGGLVLLVCVGVLLTLGGNLSNALSGMLASGRRSTPSVGAVTPGTGLAGGGSGTAGTPGALSGSGGSCISAGWCLDLSKISVAEGSTATQTTGSNGTELVADYSDVLKQIAQQVDNMPDKDPTLQSYIIGAANAGHKVADTAQGSGDVNDATISYIFISDDLRSYINQHPNILPSEVNEAIHLSLNNIQKYSVKYTTAKSGKSTADYYSFYQIPPNLQVSTDGVDSLSDFAESVHKESNKVCKAGKADPFCKK